MSKKDKYDYYYDAMDALNGGHVSLAKKMLNMALRIDLEFVDAYNGLAAAYEDEGNKKKARECADIAFNLTKRKFKKWPEEMEWGWMENRPYLRAICNKAIYLHEGGALDEAENMYRLLLKMNPHDNQGVRYLLAALYGDEAPGVVDERINKGNEEQHREDLEKMLEKQNKKHKFWKDPEELEY